MKTMLVYLSIYERLNLPTAFPTKTNFEEAIILRDLKHKIDITQDDIVNANIHTVIKDGQSYIEWDDNKLDKVPFYLTSEEIRLLKIYLKKLSNSNQIPLEDNFLIMYKKIQDLVFVSTVEEDI